MSKELDILANHIVNEITNDDCELRSMTYAENVIVKELQKIVDQNNELKLELDKAEAQRDHYYINGELDKEKYEKEIAELKERLPDPDSGPGAFNDALARTLGKTREQRNGLMDLCEMAWGIIANANGGNWELATPDWKACAERWRDKYHIELDEFLRRTNRGKF